MTNLCAGHNRAGKPCGKAPIKGSTVCRTHGGSAPQVKAAAEARVTVEKAKATAAQLITQMGEDIDEDPLVNLVRMVTTSARAERAYASLLTDEEDGRILMEVDYGKAGGVRLEPVPYLKLWNEERDRLAKICKLALDAGVAERQLRIAEAEGARVVDVVLGALTDIGLTGEDLKQAKIAVGRRFRVIDGAVAG